MATDGKQKLRVSEKQLADLLDKAFGDMSAVARELNVSRQTVHARVKKSKTLQEVRENAKERIIDIAESKLFRAVAAGQEWAVKRVLDSKRGAERGWKGEWHFDIKAKQDVSVNRLDDQTAAEILERLRPKDGDGPEPPEEPPEP